MRSIFETKYFLYHCYFKMSELRSISRQLLLLSSSKVHGFEYLCYAAEDISDILKRNKVSSVLFLPYALNDHDKYTATVDAALQKMGYSAHGIHSFSDPITAVQKAEAIFVGGGNTFRLLKSLYDNNLVEEIRRRVLKDGIPYIGSSAGTNVATFSINTTNDMPIVYPPSFHALGLVPFNINPHYIDTISDSTHMGESREDRINQYHEIPGTPSVLALREGCTLHVRNDVAILKGIAGARLFVAGEKPQELTVGADVSFLLKDAKDCSHSTR